MADVYHVMVIFNPLVDDEKLFDGSFYRIVFCRSCKKRENKPVFADAANLFKPPPDMMEVLDRGHGRDNVKTFIGKGDVFSFSLDDGKVVWCLLEKLDCGIKADDVARKAARKAGAAADVEEGIIRVDADVDLDESHLAQLLVAMELFISLRDLVVI